MNVGDGALYMKSNELVGSPWRHLWASAENNINKMRLDSIKRSDTQIIQHQTKQNCILNTPWMVGEDFGSASSKSRAIKQVEEKLIHVTKNSTKKATTVLGNLVSKLTKSPNFDEDSILTVKWEDTKCKYGGNVRACAMMYR